MGEGGLSDQMPVKRKKEQDGFLKFALRLNRSKQKPGCGRWGREALALGSRFSGHIPLSPQRLTLLEGMPQSSHFHFKQKSSFYFLYSWFFLPHIILVAQRLKIFENFYLIL